VSFDRPFYEAAEVCMDATGRCRALDLVEFVQTHYPALVATAVTTLLRKSLLREAKSWMRRSSLKEADTSQPNQLDLPLGVLPGLRPPKALAVPLGDGEYEYVRYDAATWADMQGALQERTQNVDRAIAKRQDHLLKMQYLKFYLEASPTRTIGEACALIRGEQNN
jgi:hypothetical protein